MEALIRSITAAGPPAKRPPHIRFAAVPASAAGVSCRGSPELESPLSERRGFWMVKRVTLLVLILAAAAGLLSAGLFLLSTRADQAEIRAPAAAGGGKPAVDAVANFTPFDPPRPAPPEP